LPVREGIQPASVSAERSISLFKYVSKKTAKGAAFSFGLYFVVLGLTLLEREEFSGLFFGRILLVLIYTGPILILLAVAKDILRERRRGKNDDQGERAEGR
jgi:hypothetical protein